MAILWCAQTALQERRQDHINICSDSRAAITTLSRTFCTNSQLVWNCINALNELGERCSSLTLWWIPGHSGIRGNTIADSLAKMGSRMPLTGPEPAVGLLEEDCRRLINCWIKENHSKEWNEIKTCRQAKALLGPLNTDLSREVRGLSRSELREYTQIITGHGPYKGHQYALGLCASPLCRWCGERKETSAHILCECEALMRTRRRLLETEFCDPGTIRGMSAVGVLKIFRTLTSVPNYAA